MVNFGAGFIASGGDKVGSDACAADRAARVAKGLSAVTGAAGAIIRLLACAGSGADRIAIRVGWDRGASAIWRGEAKIARGGKLANWARSARSNGPSRWGANAAVGGNGGGVTKPSWAPGRGARAGGAVSKGGGVNGLCAFEDAFDGASGGGGGGDTVSDGGDVSRARAIGGGGGGGRDNASDGPRGKLGGARFGFANTARLDVGGSGGEAGFARRMGEARRMVGAGICGDDGCVSALLQDGLGPRG